MNDNDPRSQSAMQTRSSSGIRVRASKLLKRLRGRTSTTKEDRNSTNDDCGRRTRSVDLTHKPFTTYSSSTLHVPESQISPHDDYARTSMQISSESPLEMGYRMSVNDSKPGSHTLPITLQHGNHDSNAGVPHPSARREGGHHHHSLIEHSPSAPSNGRYDDDGEPRPSSLAGISEHHPAHHNNKTTKRQHFERSSITHNGQSTNVEFLSSIEAKRVSNSESAANAVLPSAGAIPQPATPVPNIVSSRSRSSISGTPPPSLNRIGSPRFTPSLVMRQPPMPIHNLPTLPLPTPLALTRTPSRVRLRSVPALPVAGPGDHEVEADQENAGLGDSDDEDNEENETIDSHTDARSNLTVGRDPRQSSESAFSTRSPTPDFRGPPVLPAVDTSRLEFSFLDRTFEVKSEYPRGRATDEAYKLVDDYFSSKQVGRESPDLSPTRTLRPSDEQRSSFHNTLRPPVPIAGLMSPSEPSGSMYRHPSKSMVLVSSPKREAVVSQATFIGKGKAREALEATPEEGSADVPTTTVANTSSHPPLRRMRSMPTYTPSSDPPPYPSFILNRLSKQHGISAREEEEEEKLPPYSNSIHLIAIMPRKMEFTAPGVQAKDRKWRRVLCVLEGTAFKVYQCPRSVAGVGLLGDWWEKRVGVGDVSVPSNHALTAASRMSVDASAPKSTKVDLVANPNVSWPPQPPTSHSVPPSQMQPAIYSGSTHNSSLSSAGVSSTSMDQPLSASPSAQSASSSSLNATDLSKLQMSKRALIRAYTMQFAESGLGNDYMKRKNVIRLRLEGEQFLLQAVSVSEVVEWIEGFQAATNISLDLDDRAMPRGPLFPRRRRRRRRTVTEEGNGPA